MGLEVVNALISAIRAGERERNTNKKQRAVQNPRLKGEDGELVRSHGYHTNSYSLILSCLLKRERLTIFISTLIAKLDNNNANIHICPSINKGTLSKTLLNCNQL